MAKARGKSSAKNPKLVFREDGAARGDGSVTLKETNVSWIAAKLASLEIRD